MAAKVAAPHGDHVMPVVLTGPNTRHRWTEDKPYRVHYFDPKRRGTWHRYFDDEGPAVEFAAEHRLHSLQCTVEQSPRFALETVAEKRERLAAFSRVAKDRASAGLSTLAAALAEQREANRPEALEMYDRAIESLHRAASALKIERTKVRRSKDLGLARSMAKGKTRELVERARQALAVLEMNADFAEDGK